MNLRVLTEPVRPTRPTRVLTFRRRVLTHHERGVDRPAARRRPQHSFYRLPAFQHDCPLDRHDAVVLPLVSDSGIPHTGVETPRGKQRTATRPRRLGRRDDRLAGPLLDHRLGNRIFVAGHKRGGLPIEPVLDLFGDFLDALGDARPGDHRQDQLMRGVEGDVVPPVGCADGEVPGVAAAVERANGLLEAEPSDVVYGMRSSRRPERVGLTDWERDASDVTTQIPRPAFSSSEPPTGFVPRHMCPRA
jgi:hypothetical protein